MQENDVWLMYTHFDTQEFDKFMNERIANDLFKVHKKCRKATVYRNNVGTEMLVQGPLNYGGRVIIWKRKREVV